MAPLVDGAAVPHPGPHSQAGHEWHLWLRGQPCPAQGRTAEPDMDDIAKWGMDGTAG